MTTQIHSDAGASKLAKDIMGSFDLRFSDPAHLVARYSGFVLWIFVLYLTVYGILRSGVNSVLIWLSAYFAYLAALEISRSIWVGAYDSGIFRAIRILVNLVFITWLVWAAPEADYILAFFYLIPIFASIVYFSKNKWESIAFFALAALGLYLGGIQFSGFPLTGAQYFVILIGLFCLGLILYWLYHTALSKPESFSKTWLELHQSLDKYELIGKASRSAMRLTGASRSLIILFNIRKQEYIAHTMDGFELRPGVSIEDLAKECTVLASGEAFECRDMLSIYNDHTIYAKYFNCNPRSVLAEPLFDNDGQVIGVLNIAHDLPGRFERINKNQFHQFGVLLSTAISNSLNYRRAQLNEIRENSIDRHLMNTNDEKEIMMILFDYIHMLIPQADRYVIHRFVPKSENLIFASMFQDGELDPWVWSPEDVDKQPVMLKYGAGIAGHALKLKEPILVPDVDKHPWFVKTPDSDHIKSLLVAPLFDPSSEILFGTITIFSSKANAFSIKDEINLASQTYQGSFALARARHFTSWKEHGGVMKRIFDEIRLLDVDITEKMLCQKITDIAIKVLGFDVARLRMLDISATQLDTVAISGVSPAIASKLLKHQMPASVLDPFLTEEYCVERSYLIPNDNNEWQSIAKKYFYVPDQTTNRQTGWRAFDALLTPLVNQSGQMIGILSLDLPRSSMIPEPHEFEAIGVLANAAAWVIELSRTQRRLADQQRRTWAFLGSLGPELARTRDIQSVGELVVQFGAKMLNAEGCSLYVIRKEDQPEIVLTNSNYLAGTTYIGRKKPIGANPKYGLTAWVAATGNVICLNNEEFKLHPAWAGEKSHLSYLPSKECYSILIVPVKNENGEILAVISLENKKTSSGLKDFDDEDQARLKLLAKQFSQAWDLIDQYEILQKWQRMSLEEDLHDIINWYHSGVVLWIDTLDEWIRREDYKKAKELLPDLIHHAHTAVNELKTIHTDLISKSLEAKTLTLAMRCMIDAWIRRVPTKYDSSIPVKFFCPDDINISIAIRNVLVRIASGAIANALLHSGVIENPNIEIDIEIKQEKDWIRMNIKDSGVGIRKIVEGYGLTRMRHLTKQLKLIGATDSEFNVHSKPGKGTSVIVSLQLASK